jgi:hypothetical protein
VDSLHAQRINSTDFVYIVIVNSFDKLFVIVHNFEYKTLPSLDTGSTQTVSEEWWQATDTKFQAWPRVAGPPVVMTPSAARTSLSRTLSR